MILRLLLLLGRDLIQNLTTKSGDMIRRNLQTVLSNLGQRLQLEVGPSALCHVSAYHLRLHAAESFLGGSTCLEIPSISWDLPVHNRVHNSASLFPIPSHIYPVHVLPSHLFNIHFDIILRLRLFLYTSPPNVVLFEISLFLDVTQRRVVTDVSGQPADPIFKSQVLL
jgi:hypothetical protein